MLGIVIQFCQVLSHFAFYFRLLLCGNGTKVRVYSIASGEIVNDLVGHSGVVTCVIIHPENQLQALSCALDKCIIRWDYTDAVMLQVHHGVVRLHLHSEHENENFFWSLPPIQSQPAIHVNNTLNFLTSQCR